MFGWNILVRRKMYLKNIMPPKPVSPIQQNRNTMERCNTNRYYIRPHLDQFRGVANPKTQQKKMSGKNSLKKYVHSSAIMIFMFVHSSAIMIFMFVHGSAIMIFMFVHGSAVMIFMFVHGSAVMIFMYVHGSAIMIFMFVHGSAIMIFMYVHSSAVMCR